MRYFYVVTLLLIANFVQAQTIPVGSILESYFRREQLLGNFDSTFTFNYRPLVFSDNGIKSTNTAYEPNNYFNPQLRFGMGKAKLQVLPIEFKVAYDKLHPDSRNDGAMIRSRGFQTYLSGGFFAQYGPLTIQIKPEYIIAQNQDYTGFPPKGRHWETTWQSRYIWFNRIDQPERYGADIYYNVTWGQSSIRLNKWGISLGLSTENIWWGPAIRNSIMMSNNAQGFPHLTFNTQRPIKTPLGSFEGQILTGRLEGSGYKPPGHDVVFRGSIQYVPKPDDWRYFQSITFSYSPKWIKGLSLGFTRWVQQYYGGVKGTNDYFPAFSNLFRNNDNNETRSEIDRDQAAGIFGRWIWYDAMAELYFEFAKNDASMNFRDLVVDSDHSRAITVGINKLFPTKTKDEFVQFNFEWTQTSQTESRLLRNALSWYIHAQVSHGYTNNGEVLGSALGPGGNAQYLEVSWVKGMKRIGGAIERYVHNNDFTVLTFGRADENTFGDFNRYWVDYNLHGFVEWNFDRFLLRGSLFYTKSLNYQWEVLFDPNLTPFPYIPGKDRDNFNLDINLTYTF